MRRERQLVLVFVGPLLQVQVHVVLRQLVDFLCLSEMALDGLAVRVQLEAGGWSHALAVLPEHLGPVLVSEVRKGAQLRDLFEEQVLLNRRHLHLLLAGGESRVAQIG